MDDAADEEVPMRKSILVAATGVAVFGSAPLLLSLATTPASAQGWERGDRDYDRDRDRDWRDRDWDHGRGRRWREGGDCRFVVRRWIDDDGDQHVVRRRVCD